MIVATIGWGIRAGVVRARGGMRCVMNAPGSRKNSVRVGTGCLRKIILINRCHIEELCFFTSVSIEH